jgi:hypothetical protein
MKCYIGTVCVKKGIPCRSGLFKNKQSAIRWVKKQFNDYPDCYIEGYIYEEINYSNGIIQTQIIWRYEQ